LGSVLSPGGINNQARRESWLSQESATSILMRRTPSIGRRTMEVIAEMTKHLRAEPQEAIRASEFLLLTIEMAILRS